MAKPTYKYGDPPPKTWEEASKVIVNINRKRGLRKPNGPSLYERLLAVEKKLENKNG